MAVSSLVKVCICHVCTTRSWENSNESVFPPSCDLSVKDFSSKPRSRLGTLSSITALLRLTSSFSFVDPGERARSCCCFVSSPTTPCFKSHHDAKTPAPTTAKAILRWSRLPFSSSRSPLTKRPGWSDTSEDRSIWTVAPRRVTVSRATKCRGVPAPRSKALQSLIRTAKRSKRAAISASGSWMQHGGVEREQPERARGALTCAFAFFEGG
eukprot:scaffold117718_cov75-Phaeocystis_antarctica.AAC.3